MQVIETQSCGLRSGGLKEHHSVYRRLLKQQESLHHFNQPAFNLSKHSHLSHDLSKITEEEVDRSGVLSLSKR